MKKSVFLGGISALAVSAIAMSAHAGSNTAAVGGLTYLSELNLIVLQNMFGGDDVEGKTFVGGNLSNAASYGIGTKANPGQGFTPSSFVTLTVGGNQSGNLNINNGPNGSLANGVTPVGALIGGNAGTVSINSGGAPASLIVGGTVGNFNANGDTYQHNVGTSVAQGISAQTSAIGSDLMALSAALEKLTPTAGSGFSGSNNNDMTLTAANTGLGYAVIDIDTPAELAELQQSGTLDFDIAKDGSGYLPTVVNVYGDTSYSFQANNNNAAYAPYVIWNFVGATSLTFNTQFNGAVLAPLATLNNSTQINGSVAVANFDQGGEVHLGTFAGGPALPDALGVPEPSSWAMLMGGFGFAGIALRRRRAANQSATSGSAPGPIN